MNIRISAAAKEKIRHMAQEAGLTVKQLLDPARRMVVAHQHMKENGLPKTAEEMARVLAGNYFDHNGLNEILASVKIVEEDQKRQKHDRTR